MKVQVTQENLSAALQSVSRVASRNTTLPILANILIRTSKNRLLLSATNLELAISEYVGAKVEREGDITVPARLISEFVQNLPSGTVTLTAEDNSLHIATKNYTSTIHGISAIDFPSIPNIIGDPSAIISGNVLKEAISQVTGAASSDETRPVLTGVMMKLNDSTIKLAATDSYRLAERVVEGIQTTKEVQAIVPARSLQELNRLLNGNEKVAIYIDEGQMKCVAEERELISRLVDGNYPAYEQLIPASSDTSFEVNREELLRLTKVASLFSKDTAGSVTLESDKSKSKISLSSIASQVGDNTSSAKVDNLTNSDTVTFNARYLIEALQTIHDETISFSFSGKLAPCVLRPTNVSEKYLYIIMPLRS